MYNELEKLTHAEYKLAGYKIERIDGDRVWTLDGKKHREDGPAVEGSFGHFEYWIHGERMSDVEFRDQYEERSELMENTMEEDDLSILLVNIQGNIFDRGPGTLGSGKNGVDIDGFANRFHEAYEIFEEEVELWSAETGVNLKLTAGAMGDEDIVDGVKIMRDVFTKVYATFESKTDKAFYRLQLGNIQPAFDVINDSDDNLWKFQWRFDS